MERQRVKKRDTDPKQTYEINKTQMKVQETHIVGDKHKQKE